MYFDDVDRLFKFQELDNIRETVEYRTEQLSCLNELCSIIENNSKDLPLSFTSFLESKGTQIDDVKDLLMKVYGLVKDDEFGCKLVDVCQQTELPHHISTDSEIRTLIDKTKKLLQNTHSSPIAITIARSEHDEYSTLETLDFVQCQVVCLLKQFYKINPNVKCPDYKSLTGS